MRIPGRDKLSDKNSISLIYKLSFVCLFGNEWLPLYFVQIVRFLGYRNGNTCCCHTRDHKENAEDPAKRNTTGRRNKKRIF